MASVRLAPATAGGLRQREDELHGATLRPPLRASEHGHRPLEARRGCELVGRQLGRRPATAHMGLGHGHPSFCAERRRKAGMSYSSSSTAGSTASGPFSSTRMGGLVFSHLRRR